MFFILPLDNKNLFFVCREKGKQSHFKIQALEERDSSQDSEYWSKYAKLIDPQKERLWDALIEGLDKYRYVDVVCYGLLKCVPFDFIPVGSDSGYDYMVVV